MFVPWRGSVRPEDKPAVARIVELLGSEFQAGSNDEILDDFDRNVLWSAASKLSFWARDPAQAPREFEAIAATVVANSQMSPRRSDAVRSRVIRRRAFRGSLERAQRFRRARQRC